MLKNFIYGLIDPLEPEHIRYIGLATNDKRPQFHEWEALNIESTTYKRNWILSLLAVGRTYDVILIEEFLDDVERDILCAAEVVYIDDYKKKGHKLTNATLGGDGGHNRTPEMLVKMSEITKAQWKDPVKRARLIESLRATYTPERLEEMRKITTLRWKNPEYYQKVCNSQARRWEKPEQHYQQSENSRIGMNKLYKDPENCIKQSNAMRVGRSGSIPVQIYNLQLRIKAYEKVARKDPEKNIRSARMIEHLSSQLVDLQSQLVDLQSQLQQST